VGRGSVQYAALPWRLTDGAPEILLITSSNGRWIIPKGWPIDGLSPHESAAQEAWEEAGVRGEAGAEAVGSFPYEKTKKDGRTKRLEVEVFPLHVTDERPSWPEAAQRKRRWFSREEAATAVEEPGLKQLLAGFAP
jgi:8-oxo-dGTP pyrophosphatase MutT (NUDIX family)